MVYDKTVGVSPALLPWVVFSYIGGWQKNLICIGKYARHQ